MIFNFKPVFRSTFRELDETKIGLFNQYRVDVVH